MYQWNKIYKDLSHKYFYYDLNKPHEDLDDYIKLLEDNNSKTVLDLGVGLGRNLIPLIVNGFESYGIDIAKDGINKLEETLDSENLNANLAVGDIYKPLPYDNNFFDSILSIQVLQHNYESEIRETIKEMERILKPGGLVFITLCGRYAKGELRYCLVKTAKNVAPNTYIPQKGEEIGLPHFIYNKKLILDHFKNFEMIKMWKDERDYYAFFARLKG